MPDFFITANNSLTTPNTHRAFKGEIVPFSFDFSAWADDNAALTSATWTVESGDATVSGTALNSNVATGNVTVSNEGKSLIKVSGTTGTLTKVVYLSIYADEPDSEPFDYE